MSNWILFGFKGCGKTYFGHRLAKKLGYSFIDIDLLIEEKMHLSCREIVLQFGESYFRQLETQIIESLDCKHTVIAVGGGSVLLQSNLTYLQNLGSLIYLKCPKEILKKRFLIPPLPSYINPNQPEDSFEKIYSTRITQYETIPSYSIELKGKSDAQVLEELCHLINSGISFASQLGVKLTEKPLV